MIKLKKESLVIKNPELAKQWNPTKNGNLTPNDVTIGSNKKVWWMCEKGHEWEATINNRSKGKACPFCSGRRASDENNLKIVNPTLAAQWHPIKNGDLTPNDVLAKSNRKVWWLCENNHEWEAVIHSRSDGNGCPFCAGQRLYIGNSLQTVNPDLAKQWHPYKNGTLTPNDVTSSQGVKVWWLCEKGHEWKVTINSRSKGSMCPFCSGRYAYADRNLLKSNPDIAKQWHPYKNGTLTPNDVLAGSNKKVWWLCEKGHEWEAIIVNRTIHGRGCSVCNRESQTSFPEQAIYFYFSKYFSDSINRYKYDNKWEIDVFVPSLMIGIEYDGYYYHGKRRAYDTKKEKHITDGGVSLIRIQEVAKNIQKYYRENNMIYCNQHPSEHQLSEAIKMCFSYMSENITHLLFEVDIDVTRDRALINDLYITTEKENSLLTNYPELAISWHPIKNLNITPEMVRPGSNKVFWWQCEKGHEWEASVNSRTNMGSGCPYCSSRQTNIDNCLQTLNPKLAKQWHPTKNNDLTPFDVTIGSKKKVWWLCDKDHEWEASINNRAKGNGCPFCSGRFATTSNSLQAVNPNLANQWHRTKNKDLTPHDVLPFSNKKVWWQCDKGHEWEASVEKRSNGRGCPLCAKNRRK